MDTPQLDCQTAVSEYNIYLDLEENDKRSEITLDHRVPCVNMPIAQTRLETLQICKLLQCVREEDREQIKKLTVNGVPQLINYNEPKEGDTALGIAAVANDDSMIEFLLELGAHPDIVDFKGRSAIMRAAEYGHVQCLEKLAQAKANMNLTDVEGKGVLFYCISPTQRHQRCMELALEHNSDVNNKSKEGVAVFLQACETAKENEKACLMMLEKGADPNSKNDKNKRTALMAAAGSGSAMIVRAILDRGAEVNELMMRTKTHAAHEAAKGGYLDVLQIMSAYGANFDQTDDQGNTPIHLAAKYGHGLCCRFLSQRGCNPKPKNADGFTARLLAKEESQKEPIKECRKAEKSFGKIGKNNEPWAIALYDFCYERQEQLKEIFLKLDGDQLGAVSKEDFVEALTNIGSPMPVESDMKKIILTIDRGRDEGVDYNEFLAAKKYINKLYLMSAFEGKKKKKKGGKGKKGKTKVPMVICTQGDGPRVADGGPPEVFIPQHIHFTDTKRFDRDMPPEHPLQDDSAWYLQHPDKTYLNINDAAKHSDFDSLKAAFAKGTPIDVRDKYFKTPLMVACIYGNLDVVKFLVDNGANVNAQDNFKWTAMHFACHSGMKDLVEYLLEQGASLESTSLNGATPFMRAIQSSKPDVVQYLIDRGCKVQIENRKGQNPVDIASYWGDPRVYDIVKTKWDSLPPPADKKKGAKKGGGKRPASTPSGDVVSAKGGHTARPDSPQQDNTGQIHQRKGSILRAASALAGGIEEREDITFTPLKVWTKQPTTQELLCAKENKRQRYGWEVDFSDFKMPFLKNVANRCEEFGGFDDEDD